jgi:hypothetical protein
VKSKTERGRRELRTRNSRGPLSSYEPAVLSLQHVSAAKLVQCRRCGCCLLGRKWDVLNNRAVFGIVQTVWPDKTTGGSRFMSAPASLTALPQYYIADGVHRAAAAREKALWLLPARLVVQGQADRFIDVSPDQLHSPKASISRKVTARRNYPALETALATQVGRAAVPPIEIQPLGAPGQTASVPLAQVQIVP